MNIEICYNSIVEFDRARFSQYIRDRYYQWRGSTDKTWTDFAEYVGVTQQTMAAWKNAYLKRPPNQENIVKLVDKFGMEIYEILALPSPEEGSLLDVLPEDARGAVPWIMRLYNRLHIRA